MIPDGMEQKQLTVLRRKFIVTIPTSAAVGYVASRYVTGNMSKWTGRLVRISGTLLGPIIGSMVLVHLNKAEIFRIGSSMMNGMTKMREREEGPFADPVVREKWDSQMRDRQFKQNLRIDPDIENEYAGLNYKQIVDQSVRKESS
jgi:hypothetical protein